LGWQVLGNEREKRTAKDALFVELLNEERAARVQVAAPPERTPISFESWFNLDRSNQ